MSVVYSLPCLLEKSADTIIAVIRQHNGDGLLFALCRLAKECDGKDFVRDA